MQYENYINTREQYGKVSSFALFGNSDGYGGDDLLRVESEREFVDSELDRVLLPEHNGKTIVMYALNFSSANNGKGETDKDFAAFHMTNNDSKLGALVHAAPILRGAYITDLFKRYPESSASEVLRRFDAGEIVFDSAEIEEELKVVGIDPDNAIHIVLGRGVERVWKSDPLGTPTYVIHYAAQGRWNGKKEYVSAALDCLERAGLQ